MRGGYSHNQSRKVYFFCCDRPQTAKKTDSSLMTGWVMNIIGPNYRPICRAGIKTHQTIGLNEFRVLCRCPSARPAGTGVLARTAASHRVLEQHRRPCGVLGPRQSATGGNLSLALLFFLSYLHTLAHLTVVVHKQFNNSADKTRTYERGTRLFAARSLDLTTRND